MFATRIALYTALGLLLGHLGATYDTGEFWAMVGLFWALDRISYIETIEAIQREVEELKKKRKENTND